MCQQHARARRKSLCHPTWVPRMMPVGGPLRQFVMVLCVGGLAALLLQGGRHMLLEQMWNEVKMLQLFKYERDFADVEPRVAVPG